MDKHSPIRITVEQRDDAVTITQWVYDTLRNAVLHGQIPPGRALTIRELAKLMDVSTMPVREALKRLVAEGALAFLENRRIMVPHMTAMRFSELIEARIALETHAAVRALPYLNEADLEHMNRIDQAINQAESEANPEAVTRLNQAFHHHLYTANPHQVSMPLIERLWLQLAPFMCLAANHLHDYYQVDRHQEALTAIRQQNPVALQLAIAADIRDGSAFATTMPELQTLLTPATP